MLKKIFSFRSKNSVVPIDDTPTYLEKDHLFQVFDGCFDGIIITDINGIIIYVNRKILEMFCYIKDELLHEHINILLPKKIHNKHNEFINKCAESSKIYGKIRKLYALDKYGKKVEIEIMLDRIVPFYVCHIRDIRQIAIYTNSLHHMHKNDELLKGIIHSVIPSFLVKNVMRGGRDISFYHDDIIIGFFDIKDYTAQSSDTSIFHLLKLLYNHIDLLCKRHGITKIEIVGDAVMVASNMFNDVRRDMPSDFLRKSDDDDLLNYMEMHDVLDTPTLTSKKDMWNDFDVPNTPLLTPIYNKRLPPAISDDIHNMIDFMKDCILFGGDFNLELRCGIHRGKAISGLVGTDQFRYHVFGDAVNVAARMENLAEPKKIYFTEDVYQTINSKKYLIEHIGNKEVKGKGIMNIYSIR